MRAPNIALWGMSGSGKSTVARYLSRQYGYVRCSVGENCRKICVELFNSQEKRILNAFNDAVRSIDKMVWIRTATKNLKPGDLAVFDSMRFHDDWVYFKKAGFELWRIDCPYVRRTTNLVSRGQQFTPEDHVHPGETELEHHDFDYSLSNETGDIGALLRQVDSALGR